jgi:hypothetical protein
VKNYFEMFYVLEVFVNAFTFRIKNKRQNNNNNNNNNNISGALIPK